MHFAVYVTLPRGECKQSINCSDYSPFGQYISLNRHMHVLAHARIVLFVMILENVGKKDKLIRVLVSMWFNILLVQLLDLVIYSLVG